MSAGPTTALVIVSHSARLADGVVEVAAQMAPDVLLRAAGGTDDGGIGTSFDAVETAVTELLGTDGVAGVTVLTDLGSATMTAESVIESLADDDAARVTLADGPLVEGAVDAGAEEERELALAGERGQPLRRVLEPLGQTAFRGGAATPDLLDRRVVRRVLGHDDDVDRGVGHRVPAGVEKQVDEGAAHRVEAATAGTQGGHRHQCVRPLAARLDPGVGDLAERGGEPARELARRRSRVVARGPSSGRSVSA
ncbi:dihydroxyacetone kinase phosphoryl donor subunit DhaM [Georgenia sp. SUBG003]|uniref:dihydroxyacetone kinase phosphoryl donor subunit DhaM n=1 Tax=Georgenia sp. SUBG003 TaxID=1497974 RepID=UPI003AB5E437